MMDKIIKILKDNYMVIPRILLEQYTNLGLTSDELILIIYLLNDPDKLFNPQAFSNNLNMPLSQVMELINSLTDKKVMDITVVKRGTMREEKYNFDSLYQRLAFLIIGEDNPKSEDDKSFYSTFEKELGRTLSPMEYEIISTWLDDDHSEEMIIAALKEAIYNGVTSLRYIDKILYEWKKKGLKTPKDVEASRKNFNTQKENNAKLFDYDWLNDNYE